VIGDELRKARTADGLSQEELAFRADVSRNYVSMVELNQNSPTLETLIRICQALGIRAAFLVARHEQEVEKKSPRLAESGNFVREWPQPHQISAGF
jgi:transcriptional regulator with XRE-family HTH domain